MKHTNSFAIVNLRCWLIAALIHGLAAVVWVQSPAFAAEAAPAAPAAEAPAPVAEAPKPAVEAAAPAAEAPKPAAEAPAPAAEAPAPAAEAPKPAAEAPKPAAEAPKPAAEAPAPAAEAPKPPAATPEAKSAEKRVKPAADLPEKRLRFTFRYQRWSDVLEWFAEQADLSLVLDAPPPGTFNYSDNRDYSTSEALDLLNSVLLTKGYTLIRRDRMLTLIDLAGEFPEGLIPKVTLEEVEKRGKHELVTVEFSMGRRDPEAVAAAVTPLLGPYHKLLPVAPTKQLFVTDRAGVMPDVQKVVQSLPEPKDPPPVPVPPKPEPKELKVYPIDKVESETLMSILKELVSGAQLILDPNLSQLHANATATQHAQIQAVMDQVTAAAASATDRERRVELYELAQPATSTAATTKLTEMFKALAPKAVVSLKEDGTAVIAWASPAEHETIRATMDKLGGGPVGDPVKTPQLEIYRLTRVDPTKLITMLEKLVPDAKLTYDERSRSLIALAKPADQQAIRATLLQVQAESETPGADQPRFETYEVRAAETAAALDAMTAQVQPLVPEAKLTYDAKAKRLVVYGTTAEQQLVKSALEKLGLERAAGDTSTIETYPLAGADLTATQTLLAQLIPLAEFTADATQQRLIAVASAADHERIKSTLEKLRPNPADPQAAQLKFYPFEQDPPADVLELLAKVAPQAKITVDKDRQRLMVLAPPTSQTAVETAFQQFQQATPAEAKPELATYPIKTSDPASLVTLLTTQYPKAQVVLDTPNKRLLVWASSEDQAALAATIQKLEAEPAADQQPRFESYPLFGFATAAEAGTLVTSLQSLVPNARFTIDSKVKHLIVWATEKEHQTIAGALERLGQSPAPQNTPQLEVHRLIKVDATTTLALLQKLAPDAQLTLDAKSSSLIALAVPADQQLIRATLEQLQPGAGGADGAPAVRFHPLADAPADGLLSILKEMVPNAQITADAANKRLIAVAPAADHDAIQKIIEQFESSTPLEEPRKLAVYPVSAAQKKRFQAVLPTLQTDMPGLQVLTDDDPGSLTVWARPSEQLKIAELIKQLEREVPETEQLTLATYTCAIADPTTVSTFLTSLFPDAKFVVDAKSRRVLVWARPQDHEKIKPALEQLASGTPGDFELQLQSYPLSKVAPEVAVPMLQQQLPEAKVLADAKTGRVLAWASKADHAVIAQAIDQLQAGADDKHKPQLVVYPRGDADPQTLVLMLTSLVPTARVAVDAQTGGLAAWATPEDQDTIRKAIEEMSKAEVTAGKPSTKAYVLQNITAAAALPVLTAAVPTAKVSAGADASQVVAVAQPRDQQMLESILKEIDVEGAAGTKSSVVIYRLENKSSSTAVLYALSVFRSAFPNANFTLGADAGEFVAWASAKDHTGIQTLVDRLNAPPAPENAPKVSLYPLKSITATSALAVLQAALPRATFTADPADPQRLTASARPSEHEIIKTILAEIDVEGDPGSQPTVVVYQLERQTSPTSTSYAISLLTQAFPRARLLLGTELGQFVAWASAKDHEGIKSLVDRLNAGPPPEEAPEPTVYSLQHITAASAITLLTTAVPKATLTPDTEDPRRLTAFASPADHAAIKQILEKIDVAGDPAGGATVGIYKLEGATAASSLSYTLSVFRTAFPKATFSLGTEANQFVAWATEKDHTGIKAMVDQLNAAPAPEETPQVALYSLQWITAASATTVLQAAVPKATITVDPADPQRLTALARPADQEKIAAVLAKIDIEGDGGGRPQVAVYQLERQAAATATSYAISLLTQAFPRARFLLGTDVGQFVAWASAKDHTEIKALVDRLNAGLPPEEAPQATVYSLKNILATTALNVLTAAVPMAKLTPDAQDTRRLTAYASPADQATIKQILEKIDVAGDAAAAATVAVYQLEGQPSTTSLIYTLILLRTAFPQATFSGGAEPGQFVVFATAQEHEGIKNLVDQINAGPPADQKPQVALYTLKSITNTSAAEVLRAAVPKATFTADAANLQRLTASARPADHEAIKAILAIIDVEGDPAVEPSVAVYTLDRQASPTATSYAISLLTQAFPKARFLLGTEVGQFVAWASAKDQEGIQALVDRLNAGPPPEEAPQATVYSLQHITATTALSLLTTAVPKAKLAPDAEDTRRLTAYASPIDQATIKEILQKIDVEGDAAAGATVAVYQLEGQATVSTLYYTLAVFRTAFPKATFSVGADAGQFVAWAAAKDHEGIKALVEQMNAGPPLEQKPQVALYTLKFITGTAAAEVLRTAVPKATFTTDPDDPQRLTASARTADHEGIQKVLEEIDVEGEGGGRSTVQVYTLLGKQADTAMTYAFRLLTTAFPRARISLGTEPNQFVAWASPRDHQEIKALVDRLNAAPPPDEAPKAVVYSLQNVTATTAMSVLRGAVPRANLTSDTTDPQRLTAYATPAEHATIKEIVAQIDADSDPDASYTVSIYTLEGMSTRAIYYAGVFLAQVVPQAKFTPGSEEGQLVVWATPKDHAQIKTLIEQMQQAPPPELARKVTVYTLQHITGEAALTVLRSAVPKAELSADPADPQRINAWASPADHTTIEEILKQLDVKPDPASAATAAVYQLEGMSQTAAFYALRFLREAVPKANIALGAEGGQIVVWARAQDHEVIKGLVKQLVEESPDALRTAKVYSLQHATATTALQALTPVVPRANLSLGSDPSQLIAFARPPDHTKIAEIIKQLDGPPPPETEPSAVVYTLQSGNAAEAMRVIRTAVPQANLSAGAEPHQLIAWARPTDHKIIAQIVERMADKGPAELARKVVVYTIESGDATTAMALLQTALPGAEFSVGSDPRRLIAWATPADHEAIKESVDEIQAGAAQMTSQVYRLRYGDPKTALTVLTPLVPAAKMAVDADEGTLVVSAMPEDHQKIKATLDQMDGEDGGGRRPALKLHRVAVGSITNAYRALSVLFRNDATVQLSLDLDNDAIVAVASAAKQERIVEMIKALEDAARQDAQATLELYSLRNVDAESAQEILQQMLDKQGSKADISLDEISNQLVAIARPNVQEQIAQVLEQLRGPEGELEIYDLKYVDPFSAEMAILRQFDDDALAPEVSTDPVTQQLFIRATPEQQQKIRELLIKMGERGLTVLGGGSSQNMRTVPFQGDPKAALEEIRKIWPKLRENEIRVVSPDQPLPTPAPKKSSSWRLNPHTAPEFAAVIERLLPYAAFAFPSHLLALQPAESPDDKPIDEPAPPPDEPAQTTANTSTQPAAAGPPPAVSPPTAAPPSPPAAAPAPAAEPPAAPPPIYVVPGDGTITVVCDDPEALEQFEKLLRAMSGTSGEVGRNISVFNLKHSNAVEIAEKLRDLYESRRSSWRLGTTEVNIVPDERMNRILVQGSRIDRETIESLVRVLDTEEGTASKPQIVPIRFADAAEIAQVVQDVFRSQLSRFAASSSNGTRSSALSRVTPEVAVDPATNSLIVMAPSPLLDEILKLIASLDEAAEENPARRLKIIALQKTNAARVEDALQRILKSGSPRSPRPSR